MRRLAFLTLLLLAPAVASAASERMWSPLVRGVVPAGTAKGTAPTSRGTITIAPDEKELAAPPSPYLWSIAVWNGGVVAGSGDGGEVWRVPEDGAAAKLLHDAAELQAQSLAVGGDGKLYAGFNPGARVAAISADGKAQTVFDASESYVWAILPDAHGKALHVAVGSPGRVYRVEPGAAAAPRVELESGDGAVRALAFAKDGKLLAGTDGHGLVIRVDGDGQRFVLFDSPRREISSISVAPDGTIWFAAIGQEEATTADAAAASPAPTPADPKKGPPGLLFKMRPDGFAEQVWTAPGASIYDLHATDAGVWAATGDPAAVWRVEPDGSSEKLFDPSAGQATALLPQGNDVLVATANPSKVFRLGGSKGGTFEATPLDCGGFAHWGRLTWEASGADKVEITTRSGNTATPDASWSAWSAAIPAAGANVTSPPARFLQFRAKLAAASAPPELTRLDAIFRVENRAPRVDWVFLENPGVTIAPKADAPPSYTLPPDTEPLRVRKELPQKRGFQRGWRAARWAASDPDGDPLLYDVAIRGQGETAWVPLAHDLPETYTTWDETALPDGRYELRVTAKDDAENGLGKGLSGEKLFGPFVVDTTPPRIEKLAAAAAKGGITVTFEVADATGVGAAYVSIDGGAFTPLNAADGLADSPRESFSATIPAASGAHLVTVRAEDFAGNVTSAKTAVK